MNWLSQNWLWIIAAIVIIALVYRYTEKKKQQEKDRAFLFLFSKLHEALEEVVDDTVGRHYSRDDQRKIASGMIAVMAVKEISLERIVEDRLLFNMVMAESIATLTKIEAISKR